MKILFLLGAMVCTLGMMASCGIRSENNNTDTTLILIGDSCPNGGYVRLRNIMAIRVDSTGTVYISNDMNDQVMCDLNQLSVQVKDFISNPNDNPEFSEKVLTDIPLIGDYPVSKGIVSLHIIEGTPKEKVNNVFHALAVSFIDLRDSLSQDIFGQHYGELDAERASAIMTAIPIAVMNPDSMKFYCVQ